MGTMRNVNRGAGIGLGQESDEFMEDMDRSDDIRALLILHAQSIRKIAQMFGRLNAQDLAALHEDCRLELGDVIDARIELDAVIADGSTYANFEEYVDS